MSKHLANGADEGTPDNENDNGAATRTEADALYKMAEVSRVLRSATHTIEKLGQRASGSNELTLMHCLVLVHLSSASTCQQTKLKSATGIAPTHLTKLLEDLVNRGLVSRNRSSWDRRQVILALTASGRETALRLLSALHDFTQESQLGAIEQLGSSLEQFVSIAENGHWLDTQDEPG
jgi:DNA-binding MarR family transcriptional regulator